MFEKLRLLWASDATLKEQYREFGAMLAMAHDLYVKVVDLASAGNAPAEVETEVYRADVKINKAERSIRKQIVTHLALNPGQDVAGCLVLMSVGKDAERVGDHCKNLFEASKLWGRPLAEFTAAAAIDEFEAYVRETFDHARRAFDNEDDTLAAEILQDEVRWNRRFDEFFIKLAGMEIPAREAVAATLLVRALKRIQGHLSNIASSVIMPVHRIDYRPKHLREKKRSAEAQKEKEQP
jgi:phosphate uptake regulator